LPTERQLSEMFGLSRNSLREAIRVLDILGIIRVDQGSGMVIDTSRVSSSVTSHLSFALLLNRHKLNELFEARLLVETECAGLAAQRATLDEIAELHAVYTEMVAAGPDRDKGIECEMRLHALITKAGRNTILEKILDSFVDILRDSRYATVPRNGVSEATIVSQRRIIEAIESRDVPGARMLMYKHIAEVAERVRAAMLGSGSIATSAGGTDIPGTAGHKGGSHG
jgi:GntR family transcriptional regulator, transcriptional repressor for pyruvate dehydrogenase complex